MIGECRIGCVFLCVTLVSAVAVQVVGAGQRSFPGECSRPWVVVNEDLNSTIAVELSDAALNRTGLREHFRKHIRAKNLTHYFVNPQAMLAGYDTKVSEPIWTEHPGLAAAPKWVAKMKKLHDDGIDPYAEWIACAREAGVSPWVSMRMNDAHCLDSPKNGFATKMWLDHPEWRRVPNSRDWFECQFDYTNPEVQAHFLAWARELLERYDMDGFECDWLRFPHHLPRGRERDFAGVLTDFMGEIRKLADEIGTRRGKRILVGARVASSVEGARGLGTDAVEWAKAGFVDVLTVANFFHTVDFEATWADWIRLVKAANPKVKILAGVDNGVIRRCGERSEMTVADHAGYFDNAFEAGVEDGWSLFNYFMQDSDDPIYTMLVRKDFGPKELSSMRRTYTVTYRDAVGDDMPSNGQFPVVLDRRAEIRITVGRSRPGDEVEVRVYLDPKEKTPVPLAAATLNGSKPIRIASVDRCAFPPDAVRPGVNVFSVGPKAGLKLLGCELTLTPQSP